MDPKTCPHCAYIWTPRKENPKKCPQCANPLWQSPRPHKKHQDHGVVAEEQRPETLKIESGSLYREPEREPAAPPIFIDERIRSAREKAEELFNKLK